MSEMWVLSGIAVMVLGFVLRFNPLLVVVTAAASGSANGRNASIVLAAHACELARRRAANTTTVPASSATLSIAKNSSNVSLFMGSFIVKRILVRNSSSNKAPNPHRIRAEWRCDNS
jgi:hypothetical protein